MPVRGLTTNPSGSNDKPGVLVPAGARPVNALAPLLKRTVSTVLKLLIAPVLALTSSVKRCARVS